MFDTEARRERVILVAIDDEKGGTSAEARLKELAQLVETSGAEAVEQLIQKRERRHPGHYLGKGKIDELKALIAETNADAIAADDELTPAQQRKLADMLGIKILDRTMVILDIFAGRASSAEGKAQVELAQLKYHLSHLTGMGIMLSRQAGGGGFHGGGIGTRGPGEKKLETDRRHIRSRIDQLNRELKDIAHNRDLLRKKRVRNKLPVVALVGYTNAGKSTLMNALTHAGVLAEDKLFATLDTTTRKGHLNEGEALFTDTVGFIHKLPHHLIRAFRATLEETQYADVLLHVVDASSPDYALQMHVVYDTLKDLKCMDKPVLTAFNKIDLLPENAPRPVDATAKCVYISAKQRQGLDALLLQAEAMLQALRRRITVLIPYSQGQWVSLLHGQCEVLSEQHTEGGTLLEAYVDGDMYGKLTGFEVL
jgi:GTP-binding protein HflX